LNFVVVPELAVGIVIVVAEVAEIVVDFVAEVAEDCFEMVGFVKIANFLETVLGSICQILDSGEREVICVVRPIDEFPDTSFGLNKNKYTKREHFVIISIS
jgi:hypothetical protein